MPFLFRVTSLRVQGSNLPGRGRRTPTTKREVGTRRRKQRLPEFFPSMYPSKYQVTNQVCRRVRDSIIVTVRTSTTMGARGSAGWLASLEASTACRTAPHSPPQLTPPYVSYSLFYVHPMPTLPCIRLITHHVPGPCEDTVECIHLGFQVHGVSRAAGCMEYAWW